MTRHVRGAARTLAVTLGLSEGDLRRVAEGWRPVFIAGAQLTGKSTAARLLAQRLGAQVVSGGSVVRSMAADEGLTVAEMSRRMRADPWSDMAVDRGLAVAATGRRVIVESRMAGWLGLALEEMTGSSSSRVLLECCPQERAFRWLHREFGADVALGARQRARALARRGHLEEAMLHAVRCAPGLDAVSDDRIREAARRDVGDRRRLVDLYGVDYDEPSVFTVVLDVTRLEPAAVVDQLEALVPGR